MTQVAIGHSLLRFQNFHVFGQYRSYQARKSDPVAYLGRKARPTKKSFNAVANLGPKFMMRSFIWAQKVRIHSQGVDRSYFLFLSDPLA